MAVATSDGQLINYNPLSDKEEAKMRYLERKEGKQARGSRNRRKTRGRINRIHARARHRRKEFVEQTTHALTRDYDIIGCENLKIKSMTASARGTLANPGRNVRQKAGLNRSMLNKSLGLLLTRLDQKGEARGNEVVAVPPHYTSQTCPECEHVNKASRVTRGFFICTACGHAGHADVTAARNIEAAALSTCERGVKLARSDGTPDHARSGYKPGSLGNTVAISVEESCSEGSPGRREVKRVAAHGKSTGSTQARRLVTPRGSNTA